MPDQDFIEIKISKLIHAPKWKLVRLLTRIEEFPAYIPSIKEASVIKKTRNIMQTKWRIEVDKVPISWVEEDILALRQDAFVFLYEKKNIQRL